MKLLQIFEKYCNGVSFKRYKLAKKEAKKAVQNARAKVYKEIYEKLNTKEVEKNIYISVSYTHLTLPTIYSV